MSVIRNDPGLIYDTPKESPQNRKSFPKTRPAVSSTKTDVSSGTAVNSKHHSQEHQTLDQRMQSVTCENY